MSNRARLIVRLGGPWRLYQRAPLPGWEMLGTVQRGDEIGALGRHTGTSAYAMLRAGTVSSLDQRKVAAALAAGADGP